MPALIGWLLIACAAVFPALGIYLNNRATRQSVWPKQHCRIIRSVVVNLYETYKADVQFEYAVSGATLTGTTIKSGLLHYNWRSPAERLCAKYPVGSECTVYVNPANPNDAVLEPGGDKFSIVVIMLISAFLGLLGLAIVGADA